MDGTGNFVLALLGIVLLNAFCQTDRKIRSLEDAPQSADPVRKLLAAGGVLLGCSVLLHPVLPVCLLWPMAFLGMILGGFGLYVTWKRKTV